MDTKILYHLATIGMSKFDLLAYRYGFLTTSTFVEGELRLCAFDQSSPDCRTIVSNMFPLDEDATEESLNEFIDDNIALLKKGILCILESRAESIKMQIESLTRK